MEPREAYLYLGLSLFPSGYGSSVQFIMGRGLMAGMSARTLRHWLEKHKDIGFYGSHVAMLNKLCEERKA